MEEFILQLVFGSGVYRDKRYKTGNEPIHTDGPSVTVKYQDTTGNTIRDDVVQSVEKGKDFTPDVPNIITKDDKTYEYLKRDDGKSQTDKIGPVNEDMTVIMIYNLENTSSTEIWYYYRTTSNSVPEGFEGESDVRVFAGSLKKGEKHSETLALWYSKMVENGYEYAGLSVKYGSTSAISYGSESVDSASSTTVTVEGTEGKEQVSVTFYMRKAGDEGKHTITIEYIYEGKPSKVIGVLNFDDIKDGDKFPTDRNLNAYAFSSEELKLYFGADKEYVIESKAEIDGKKINLSELPANITVDKNIVIKFFYYIKGEYYVRIFTATKTGSSITNISCVSDETKEGELGKSITVNAPGYSGEYQGYRVITDGTKPGMSPSNVGSLSKGSSVKITLAEDKPTACVDFVYLTAIEETPPGDGEFPEGSTKGGLESRAEVKLRSNDRDNEEYNVGVGIPTSEDLYTNILADGYILEWTEMERKTGKGKISLCYTARYEYYTIKTHQEYDETTKRYKTVYEKDANGDYIYVSRMGTVSSKTDSDTLDYAYWVPTGASLYKIDDSVTVSNGVLNNSPVRVPLSSYGASLSYSESAGFNTSRANQKKSQGSFYCEYGESAYSEAKKAVDDAYNAYHVSDFEALKNSQIVQMGKIIASGTGSGSTTILDGQYKSCADSLTYEPTIPNSAPKINRDVLYKYKDLHVGIVSNSSYPTTANITYKYAQKGGKIATVPSYQYSLSGNSVKVHTPVVNYAKLDLTDNQKYNQLINAKENTIVVGRKFTVEIPHGGEHVDAKGYGNRDYNYKGMTRDVNGGISNNHFAKKRTIVFEGTGVIYNNKYYASGEVITITDNSKTKFEFIIPEWEEEVWKTKTAKIITRVFAENCTNENLEEDKANKNSSNYAAKRELEIRVIGEMSDLRIRGTNDPSWVKIKEAITTERMPIGQAGQNSVAAYKYALKLGYSAYFDLKVVGSKGDTSTGINIVPSYYYIPKTGGSAQKVDLYYHNSVKEMYVKLSNKPVNIEMTMTNAKGTDFNTGFTNELVAANKLYDTKYNYQQKLVLGNTSKITLPAQTRLPYVTANAEIKAKYISAPAGVDNAVGHWYGAVRIPASTLAVAAGTTNVNANSNFLKEGYIAIVFDSVETESDGIPYLSYAKGETKWPASGNKTIALPNGNSATVPSGTAVLYEANIRANNDYETGGTH